MLRSLAAEGKSKAVQGRASIATTQQANKQTYQPTCRPDRAGLCVKHTPICTVERSHIPHIDQEAISLHHVLEGGPAQL